jgi:hypothetical protein
MQLRPVAAVSLDCAWLFRILAVYPSARLTLSVAGCGGDGSTAIMGTVTLDRQPVEPGTIEFLPADDRGPAAAAQIDGGLYEGKVLPRRKTVVIHGYRKTGERPVVAGNPESPMVPILAQVISDENHHALDSAGGGDVKIESDLGLERFQTQPK